MTPDANDLPRPEDKIGQREAQALVEHVIQAPTYADGLVYHILGNGGIGKSHLLREAHTSAYARIEREAGRIPRLETGLIDLAHTRYQHPLWLMNTLARRISCSLSGQANNATLFAEFNQQAQFYIQTQGTKAQSGESLGQVRAAFLHNYAHVARQYPIVLTIDTFERLDPSMSELEPYNFRPLNRLEVWLLDLINALTNTLTLIAGRTRPRQARLVAERLGTRLVRRLDLQPFTPTETREYMERHGDRQHDLAWYTRMHKVSGGHPVRLIVAIELARAANFDLDQLPPSLQGPGPADPQQLGKDFSATCIGSLYNSDPAMATMIEQATFLRKGLYIGLLEHLARAEGDELAVSQIPALLERLHGMAFVKVSGDGIASLHDDIGDMLWEHVNHTSAHRWYASAIEYLQAQINKVNVAIKRDGLSVERLARLRANQIDRLYYQLARAPTLPGYQNYCELAYSAILGHDEEFDAQLQEEFARFFDQTTSQGKSYQSQLQNYGLSWQRVLLDEAVRWVFRRIYAPPSQGKHNQQVLALADLVEQNNRQLLDHDPLANNALEVARLEAADTILRQPEQVVALRQRYDLLATNLRSLIAQPGDYDHPITNYTQQQSRFFLAYALNRWGYFERVQQQLKTAAKLYRESISLFKMLGSETISLRATTLNNLAFALAEQGELDLGLLYAQKAASLQRAVGHRYREAAVHTNMAQICLELNDIPAAEWHIGQARSLLREYPQTRFAAICAFGEGQLKRWLGFRNRADSEVSKAQFAQALACYEEALSFFKPGQGEPDRLAEIYQGLGCTYRNRGHTYLLRGEAGALDMEEARTTFTTALEYCSVGLPLRASLMEDIAVTYVHERRFGEAQQWLQFAAQQIPNAYTIDPAPGQTAAGASDEIQKFWLQRAQVELQLALCAFGLDQPAEAGDRLLRAFAALYRFSPRAQQVATFRVVARNHIVALRDPAQIRQLRQSTYLGSQRLQTREAFFELNRLLLEAEEIVTLLGAELDEP